MRTSDGLVKHFDSNILSSASTTDNLTEGSRSCRRKRDESNERNGMVIGERGAIQDAKRNEADRFPAVEQIRFPVNDSGRVMKRTDCLETLDFAGMNFGRSEAILLLLKDQHETNLSGPSWEKKFAARDNEIIRDTFMRQKAWKYCNEFNQNEQRSKIAPVCPKTGKSANC
jgi:hypothetical protein